ncbi:MAG: phosphatidate cytidylyltransferase [Erysipelotrichales bacterium]|nr:phosphatidate cytidylyltransferase [Erysipelotrichales bacterium]
MKTRFLTGIILALILVPILVFNQLFPLFEVLGVIFVILAAIEMLNMFSKKKPIGLLVRVATIFFTLMIYYSAISIADSERNLMFDMIFRASNRAFAAVIMGCLLTLFTLMVFKQDFEGSDVGHSLTTMNYVGLGIASLMVLRLEGLEFIIFALLIPIATDVFAYLFGVKFGRHKMAPNISPKKSWEGAIAGTFFAIVLGTIFAYFYGSIFEDGFRTIFGNPEKFGEFGELARILQLVIIVFVTFAASVIGQIGDLVASKLKRTYDIKDFGTIFPGHGGVLDRFDSVIFVSLFLVIVFTFIRYMLII